MKAGFIDSSLPIKQLEGPAAGAKANAVETGKGFFSYLQDAMQEANSLQQEASSSAQQLALGGEQQYLHNTTIAYEKAILALQLTVEIRNKIVEAYQEIMRMQM